MPSGKSERTTRAFNHRTSRVLGFASLHLGLSKFRGSAFLLYFAGKRQVMQKLGAANETCKISHVFDKPTSMSETKNEEDETKNGIDVGTKFVGFASSTAAPKPDCSIPRVNCDLRFYIILY
ncbi:hypothetical protein DM860_011216 [Cuscuta australis]|uniref:Uncharacterized protein n=1 Tax=Cuscuta australis TaxID=267555 RepID=A0A328DS59_9ASTE|nr:hypothetical protein DM860_011216 [Cuscuta australis]